MSLLWYTIHPSAFIPVQNSKHFYLLRLTHGKKIFKGLIHLRCGTRNMVELSDDILPEGKLPTFTSIAQYEAYILCLCVCKERSKYTEVFDPAMSTRLPCQKINCATDYTVRYQTVSACSRTSDLRFNNSPRADTLAPRPLQLQFKQYKQPINEKINWLAFNTWKCLEWFQKFVQAWKLYSKLIIVGWKSNTVTETNIRVLLPHAPEYRSLS